MNARIDAQAIDDLLQSLSCPPKDLVESLALLKGALPFVERADSPEGEDRCVAGLAQRLRWGGFEQRIRSIIRELCHYPAATRRQIIDAAASRAAEIVQKAKQLEQAQAELAAAIGGLDDRTKALLHVIIELQHLDSHLDTDFVNVWRPHAQNAPVDVLRSDPVFAGLMQAYDLAVDVNKAVDPW